MELTKKRLRSRQSQEALKGAIELPEELWAPGEAKELPEELWTPGEAKEAPVGF